MNISNLVKTISGMWGTFLLYKIISLTLLYNIPNLQDKPYYEFIYFGIVSLISLIIIKMCHTFFNNSVTINPRLNVVKKQVPIFIVPIIIYSLDFFSSITSIFTQPILLIFASIFSAFGAGMFEELRDRWFGLTGFNNSLAYSKWKPLIMALVTSFLFSTTHYFNLLLPNSPSLIAVNQQVVYTFFMGMVFSILTMRTGTIFYAILFHTLNNMSVWTPQSDLATASPWSYMLITNIFIPLLYSLWCLRPSKAEKNLKFLN